MGVEAHSTLHEFSSRGEQWVLPGSVSFWEGSEDLLSLCWPSSARGGVYSLQFLPGGGGSEGGAFSLPLPLWRWCRLRPFSGSECWAPAHWFCPQAPRPWGLPAPTITKGPKVRDGFGQGTRNIHQGSLEG